jgi:hypothetical protein
MIRKFYATKDNTITNAYQENLTTRGTGSNMGASDILEVFSIYGQASSSSVELSRALIQFNPDFSQVPASGVSWYLKMFNAPHSQTVPSEFTMTISAVSQSWEEGYGIDMENYEDITRDGVGSNWINRASGSAWDTEGGDYRVVSASTMEFSTGLEDLEVDVSDIVNEWRDGTWPNYGFGVALSSSHESETKSFYTKKFFGRDSEFYLQRPVLEARWDSARKDDRGSFYASSSFASATDNLNTLYLYNRIRGRLRDYPVAPTSASIRTAADVSLVSASVSRVDTGIYMAQLAADTSESTVYDVWYSGSTAYHTGTISVKNFASYGYNPEDIYVLSMPGLRKEYRKNQTHRLNLYVREKNWSPNIYTVAVQSSIPSLIIPSASYQLRRSIDDYVITPYGTGSTMHTQLSYDVSGNYFDLDTTYLEAGYLYEIQYSFYDEENGWEEQPYRFKFRVVD